MGPQTRSAQVDKSKSSVVGRVGFSHPSDKNRNVARVGRPARLTWASGLRRFFFGPFIPLNCV